MQISPDSDSTMAIGPHQGSPSRSHGTWRSKRRQTRAKGESSSRSGRGGEQCTAEPYNDNDNENDNDNDNDSDSDNDNDNDNDNGDHSDNHHENDDGNDGDNYDNDRKM